MRKISFILLIGLLSVVAFVGALVVNAALTSPTQTASANPATSKVAARALNQNYDLSQSQADDNLTTDIASVPNLNDPTMAFEQPNMSSQFGPNAAPEVRGIISTTSAINGGYSLVLRNKHIVTTNSQTTIGDANGSLNVTDLKTGDLIFALGAVQSDKSIAAKWVLRLPAPPQLKRGKVISTNVSDNSFQFASENITWTVSLSTTTKINKAGKSATLHDIATNDKVSVVGMVNNNAHTIQATVVQDGGVRVRSDFLLGIVNTTDVSGGSFVVTETAQPRQAGQNQPAPTSGAQIKVTVDNTTRYIGQNFKGLGDLKAGDRVIVNGAKQSDGSYKAMSVARVPGFPAGGNKKPGQSSNFPGGKGNAGGSFNG